MTLPAVLETPRAVLEALLTEHLPTDIRVLPYARNIDPPTQSTVMVRIDKVRPSKAAGGHLEYDFALVLVSFDSTAGEGDEELDALLEDVLFALDHQDIPNGVTFTEATRAVFEESHPAYEVLCTVTFEKHSSR